MTALLAALAVFALALPSAASAEETPTPSPTPSSSAGPDAPTDSVRPTDGSYIAVTLLDSSRKDDSGRGTPVPGVTVSVSAVDGTDVGEGVTDRKGLAFVALPALGSYEVELDTSTLPDGVTLSGSGSTTRTVAVKIEGANPVQFQIGVTKAAKKPFDERLTASVLSGVKFGLIIALAALGLSLIFGTTGLTNFAHGELITFGALMTYVANVTWGLPVIAAGVVAMLFGGAFGYANDRLLWRPLRRRGTGLIAMMIVSIGLGLFLRSIYQYQFGASTRTLSDYVTQRQKDFGPFSLAPKEVGIMLVSVAVITIVCIALMRTRMGKAMRAVSDNPALSASSGLRVDGVISTVWVLGAGLTALSGTLLAINSQVNFLMGFKLLLLVFAAVTLGGLGTIWGALVGSMVIGIMVEVGPLFGVPSSIKDVGALVVLILILLIRPQGILGRRERIG